MDFEVNLEKAYAAGLSSHAWTLLAYFLHELSEKGFIAGVEFEEWSDPLEELVKAEIVKRYGRNIRIDPAVAKLV